MATVSRSWSSTKPKAHTKKALMEVWPADVHVDIATVGWSG